MFASGFDTRIKMISSLVSRLISDAVLDFWPCCNHTLHQFISGLDCFR